MQQTTSPSTFPAGNFTRAFCYYPAAVAVALVVKTGRALRLLPSEDGLLRGPGSPAGLGLLPGGPCRMAHPGGRPGLGQGGD